MRLLLYVPNAWWSGMQCWATYLLKHLPRDEFEVLIVAWTGVPEALADLGSRGQFVHLDCPAAEVEPRIAELIERWRPDVVHAGNVRVGEAAVAAGVPYLTTLHSAHGDGQKRTGCEIADEVYKVSPAVPGDYPVILSGIDAVPWRDQREHQVVFIGRLDADRAPERLLRAMPEVRRRVPDVSLRIIGAACPGKEGFDLAGKLREYELDDITKTTGLLPPAEARRLMAGGDVVCAPAPDGFGFGIAEGMSAGLIPVVCSRGYGPEMVGDYGVVVNRVDRYLLADALVHALTDEGLRSQRWAMTQRVKTLYSAERFAAEYARVYREMR